jgi:hypothetical protein
MINLQKDPNAKLLKSFLPPFKGTWKTLPAYLLPEDVVQDSLNVTLMGGKLRSRPGLNLFNRLNLGDRIIGSFLSVDTTDTKYPFCSTKNKVFRLLNNRWQDITNNVVLTATDSHQVRMTSIQIGTSVYVLYANGKDRVKQIPQSTYLLSDITPVAGSIPVLTDICTSFSRLVGITPPYTVTWSDVINDQFLSFTSWPALNQAILADTEDSLVAIRALGTLGLAIYKEGNIFTGFAQTGANSQAFRFEHRGEYEGPAGVQALVNVEGAHMRMTSTGRVGLFDGTQNIWIADGIWPLLQDTLDIQYAKRIFGVYDYKTAQVTFWYPRFGDNGACKGMLNICLPYPLAGVTQFSYFLGESNFECTNGLSVRLFNASASPFVFGNNNQTFQLDKNSYGDNGFDFSCSFKPGLFKPTPPDDEKNSSQDIYIPTVEVYASRGSLDFGTVNVSVLTSNTLEGEGKVSVSEILDLRETPINEIIAYDKGETGSFLGVNFEWESSSRFEYKGCDISGRAVL